MEKIKSVGNENNGKGMNKYEQKAGSTLKDEMYRKREVIKKG